MSRGWEDTRSDQCYNFFLFEFFGTKVPWSNAFWPGLTPFDPPMWQAEAEIELPLSASPTTAVGQKALAMVKRRYSTVLPILSASNP